MKIEHFEDLEIWQEARKLCLDIKRLSNNDNFSRDFRFKDQILSSSGSVMDNIAEGFERGGNKEFINFLGFAKGSCGETRSQLYRAFDFQYISNEEFDSLLPKAISLSKKISGFISYLKTSEYKGFKFK